MAKYLKSYKFLLNQIILTKILDLIRFRFDNFFLSAQIILIVEKKENDKF